MLSVVFPWHLYYLFLDISPTYCSKIFPPPPTNLENRKSENLKFQNFQLTNKCPVGCFFLNSSVLPFDDEKDSGDPWYPWRPMDINGYPWISIHIHGYPLTSMDIHGYPWNPWISIDIHGYPCISMDIHGCPLISMENQTSYFSSLGCHSPSRHPK